MNSFNEIYQELVKDTGDQLKELKRKNTGRNILLIGIIIAFAIIILVTKMTFLWIFFALFLIVIIILLSKAYTEYALKYKQLVIKRFIKGYSDKLEYFPERGISSSTYNESRFDGYYDRYHSEDLIEGELLENCKIIMSEVHTERQETTTDSNGHTTTTYTTIFHGLFARIELNQFSNVMFQIRKNSIIGDIFKGKTKLDMDSGEFEKIFDVKTDDKISTLRILTSDVMQSLIDFKAQNKITPEIILNNNILYIRYSVGNVFEPNLVKNDMDYDKLKNTYDMINFTFDLAQNFVKNIREFEK